MRSISTFLFHELLDHVFGAAAYTAPGPVYAAAFVGDPEAGGTECTGGSYARVSVTNNATNFPAASGGVKTTGAAIEFPAATASWGNVTHVAFYDASTSGNRLASAALAEALTVETGFVLRFAAGAITITNAAAS
jgi:hypothetical protein